MSNNNCLEGMCCPECNQEDCFDISVQTWARMRDDGVEDYQGCEYDKNSACFCPECGFAGKVSDFMKPEDKDEISNSQGPAL